VRIDKAGMKSKAILKASNSFTTSYEHGEITYPIPAEESTLGWWVLIVLVALTVTVTLRKLLGNV